MSPVASNLTFVGFGREVTPGTSVAPTAYMPVKEFNPSDKYNYVADEGVRGSYVTEYDYLSTQAWSEYSFGGDVFVDVIGWVLKGLLGEEAISGAADPYTHTFTVLNTGNGQPPTTTITDYNGFNARRFPFGLFSELTVSCTPDGLLTYSALAKGFKSATAATPTKSFSTVAVKQGWVSTVTIDGTATSLGASWEITVSRPVDPILALNGTQDPYKMWAGKVSVGGKLSIIYEDDTFLSRYTAGTQGAIVLAATSGTPARGIEFTMTKGLFVDPTDLKRDGQYGLLDVTFKGVANTTDVGTSAGHGPVKAVLKNAQSTAY